MKEKLCGESKGNKEYSCGANHIGSLRCCRSSDFEATPYPNLRDLLVYK